MLQTRKVLLALIAALSIPLLCVVFLLPTSFWTHGSSAAARGSSTADLRNTAKRYLGDKCQSTEVNCIARSSQLQDLSGPMVDELWRIERNLLVIENYERESEHRIRTLWAHYAASWVLLCMVIGIVVAGLHMSYRQLGRDLKTGQPNANSFKISKDGIEVNSPVIGLIIFLASTYFFVIYVEKIYPLTFHSADAESKSSPATTSTGARAASAP